MMIIGTSAHGYLVEMTADEIARAAGYYSSYSTDWQKANGRCEPRVGSQINLNAAFDFHSRITGNQSKAKEAASTLRALAGLLDGAMPDVVLPPAGPPRAEHE